VCAAVSLFCLDGSRLTRGQMVYVWMRKAPRGGMTGFSRACFEIKCFFWRSVKCREEPRDRQLEI
jgi:hypothetical protein